MELKKENTKIETSNYYIAYLDFIGTKARIEKESSKFLQELNSIYISSLEQVKIFKSSQNMNLETKIFSDNIVIAIKCNETDEEDKKHLLYLMALCGIIQGLALSKGLLIRGAITEGDLYIDNLFVYGKGLVDVVNLESKCVMYPRIIFRETLANKISPNGLHIYAFKCNDNFYSVDFYCFFRDKSSFDIFKEKLLYLFNESKQNIKHEQKIMWLIKYHNDFCKNKSNVGEYNIVDEHIILSKELKENIN